MEFFKPGKYYDFMSIRKYWIAFSVLVVIAASIAMFYPGPNYGTDFRGGTEIEVAFTKDTDAAAVRAAIARSNKFSEPDIVKVKDDKNANRFLIRVQEVSTVETSVQDALKAALCYSADPKSLDATKCPEAVRATEVKFSKGGDKIALRYETDPDLKKIAEQVASVPGVVLRVSATNPQLMNPRDHKVEVQLQSKGDQLMAELRTQLGADTVPAQALRVEWVGGKAGEQLRSSARNSVAIAIVFIMLYLAFRFDLRFAPGVILACLHDAMAVIGVFILLHKEISLSTIAAILTIVGYSMNDTVVVYDRIRENLGRYRGKPFAEIINMSVSESLSRTILTSGATMLSVLAFFFYGTGVIKDFALAMVIGIVAGTYSSIYVAAPLTEMIDSYLAKRQKAAAPAAAVTEEAEA
jgi:preprotein translocase subunit SecF